MENLTAFLLLPGMALLLIGMLVLWGGKFLVIAEVFHMLIPTPSTPARIKKIVNTPK